MPRVESGADVTLVVLVYRSARWLEWCMAGADAAKTDVKYRWLVVANDASDEVIGELQVAPFEWIDHRSDDPEEFYINRVYRAWNRGVSEARTQRVVMLNSDMYPGDHWLDELVWAKKDNRKRVPTSLLIESGRLPSAMPAYVMDLGRSPVSFQKQRFLKRAAELYRPQRVREGRLFMPILVERQEFFDVGAYPIGNPVGTTGDKDLIRRYAARGFEHVTAWGSVVYHAQEGEMRWP